MVTICYANPAGNVTAIVRSPIQQQNRISLAKRILEQGLAEQVGFEVPPIHNGCARLEMMGGEFCGNAARSFGYLTASKQFHCGTHSLSIEISGTEQAVPVTADLDAGTSYAQMPLPVSVKDVLIDGTSFPVVCMNGIDHLIAESILPNEQFLQQALSSMQQWSPDACGVMFLNDTHLTPAVYVRDTDSLVWESSCGSGSVACAWYLAGRNLTVPNCAALRFAFSEPGGTIEVILTIEHETITSCMMGGRISLSPDEEIPISIS